jgi:hypothetical protein
MEDDTRIEALIEERRTVWSAAGSTYSDVLRPVSAIQASHAFDLPDIDLLEDTIPLARYRPERL